MSATPFPETQPASLVLGRPNGLGQRFGLREGDRLISVNGGAVAPDPAALTARLNRPGLPAALCFERARHRWFILSDTAALGAWRRDGTPVDLGEGGGAPIEPATLRNWEVLRAPDGRYDVQPVTAPVMALLVPPLWLAQMHLWGPLAIWAALVLVGWPVGWPAMLALHAILSLYFWKAGPALWRADRLARGLAPDGVIATRTERELHRRIRSLHPEARYLHVPPRLAAAAVVEGG